jgi:Holliday junction resolvase RusA-like endonuclease
MNKTFTSVLFVVPGNPKPKGRPRFFRRRAYTPTATKKEQERIRQIIREQIEENPRYQLEYPLNMPVSVELVYHIKRPATLNRKKCIDNLIPHSKRPDVDNLAKLTLDSLDEILLDDSLIHELKMVKYYCSKTGENAKPKTIIRLEFLHG